MQSETPKRVRRLTVRFTPQEFADLEARAQIAALELSAFVRKIILDAPVPPWARRRAPDIDALGRILVALNRIGNNINQIAREAHVTGDLTAYHEADEERTLLVTATQAVVKALE